MNYNRYHFEIIINDKLIKGLIVIFLRKRHTTLPTVTDVLNEIDTPASRDTHTWTRPLAVRGGTSHFAFISENRKHSPIAIGLEGSPNKRAMTSFSKKQGPDTSKIFPPNMSITVGDTNAVPDKIQVPLTTGI